MLISPCSNSHVWLLCSALEGLVGRGKDSFTSKGLSLCYNPNPTGVKDIYWFQGALDQSPCVLSKGTNEHKNSPDFKRGTNK